MVNHKLTPLSSVLPISVIIPIFPHTVCVYRHTDTQALVNMLLTAKFHSSPHTSR